MNEQTGIDRTVHVYKDIYIYFGGEERKQIDLVLYPATYNCFMESFDESLEANYRLFRGFSLTDSSFAVFFFALGSRTYLPLQVRRHGWGRRHHAPPRRLGGSEGVSWRRAKRARRPRSYAKVVEHLKVGEEEPEACRCIRRD